MGATPQVLSQQLKATVERQGAEIAPSFRGRPFGGEGAALTVNVTAVGAAYVLKVKVEQFMEVIKGFPEDFGRLQAAKSAFLALFRRKSCVVLAKKHEKS